MRKNCVEDVLEGMLQGDNIRGRRRYQNIVNIMVNRSYEATKRRKSERVGNIKFAVINPPS